jgi:hypothetical protein
MMKTKSSESFNDLVEVLLADRSPARRVGRLPAVEQRMMWLAQRIRGTQTRSADSAFVQRLRTLLRYRSSISVSCPEVTHARLVCPFSEEFWSAFC